MSSGGDRDVDACLDALLARLITYVGMGPVADVLAAASEGGWPRLGRKQLSADLGNQSPYDALIQLWPEGLELQADKDLWHAVGAEDVLTQLPRGGWPDPVEWRLSHV